MMYNKLIEDYFFFPLHVGTLNLSEPRTVFFTNAQFSKEIISLYLQCDRNLLVKKMTFKTNGNPYMIASLEWLCRYSIGKNLTECDCNHEEIIKLFEIPFNQMPVILQVQDAYKEVIYLMNNKFEGEV